MQKLKALSLVATVTASLAGCASFSPPARPLPVAPYAHLSLAACKNYGSAIVDCQLEYGLDFERQSLGSVQRIGRGYASRGDHRYEIASCSAAPRLQRQLPNYVCHIYGARSGADAGSILVKGGTAVRLAQISGDQEQIHYRWIADRWSRVRD